MTLPPCRPRQAFWRRVQIVLKVAQRRQERLQAGWSDRAGYSAFDLLNFRRERPVTYNANEAQYVKNNSDLEIGDNRTTKIGKNDDLDIGENSKKY